MSHPYVHAESSVKTHGGKVEDYIKLHSWFDETKSWTPDWRHRAIRHHIQGIHEAISVFGEKIINDDGKEVSVFELGVQHCEEDVGFLPTAADWFDHFEEETWEEFRNQKIQERLKLQRVIGTDLPTSVKEVVKNL